METPKTLQAAIVQFGDPQRAFDAAVQYRWPGGNVTCPRCGKAKHSFIKTRRIWFCYDCKKQFTVKVGTVMEDSPIGLDKWMVALWMLGNCKNGISSYELGKALGIRQNSAWFMLHRIRLAMQGNTDFKLGGGVVAQLRVTRLSSARIPIKCIAAANWTHVADVGRENDLASSTRPPCSECLTVICDKSEAE